MKKGIVCFILLAFLFFMFPSSSEELELEIEEPVEIILPTEIENEEIILDEDLDLNLDLDLNVDSIFLEKLQTNNLEKLENPTKEYNFNIKMLFTINNIIK